MPSQTFARGSLKVSYPPSYDVSRRRRRARTRALPGDPSTLRQGDEVHDLLLKSLQDSGFDPVEALDLTPAPRSRDLQPGARARANRAGVVALDLDLAGEEDAVVLLEQDGCYSWHLPSRQAPDRTERSRDIGSLRRQAHFEIDVRPAPTTRRPRGAAPAGSRDRGLLGTLVTGSVRAFVLKFAAPLVAGKAISLLERNIQPGLVHLTTPNASTWTRFDTLDQLQLPTDRQARVLLFVHGTFSSTIGGFGALAHTATGERFLERALTAYDAVIGFDHQTLSVDPLANATDLSRRLAAFDTDFPPAFDIICHSRGGLVTRSLAEFVLPTGTWKAGVDRVVFVAATNAGTHLADSDRWGDLIDLYTNLTAASARQLSLVPGAAPVVAIVNGVVQGLGALVKFLASYAVEDDGVPGLAAMSPEGKFVKAINGRQPGQPQSGTPWFVVRSNFHVSMLGGDRHLPAEFPKALVERLGEGFVDQVFKGDNDLVVDDASMGAIDLPGGGFVRGTKDFGTNPTVYHTNYFSQEDVGAVLQGWLIDRVDGDLPGGPGGGGVRAVLPRSRDLEAVNPDDQDFEVAEPIAVDDLDDLRGGLGLPRTGGAGRRQPAKAVRRRTAKSARPPTTRALPPPPMAGPPPAMVGPPPLATNGGGGGGAAPPAGDASSSVSAHLQADMPGRPEVLKPATVTVRLSRKEIRVADDLAAGAANVRVAEDVSLEVTIINIANAPVIGADRDVFELPAGGGTSTLEFAVQPAAVGPVEVCVAVRQEGAPVGTVTLRAKAVAASGARPAVRLTSATATVKPSSAAAVDGLPRLTVIETHPDGADVVFLYFLDIPGQRPYYQEFQSAHLTHPEAFVSSVFGAIRQTWDDDPTDAKGFLRELQDQGANLFDQLFPRDLQEVLWDRRLELANLVVYTTEPYIPWELVHFKRPGRRRPATTAFFAELGMVRWQFDTQMPEPELRHRRGRVFSLCPHYLDNQLRLAGAAAESAYLAAHLAARATGPSERKVVGLLERGGFDVLHFSGHGAADGDDIANARILLAGHKRGNTILVDSLSSTTVAQIAKLGGGTGHGPLVVLNACQAGRVGHQVSSLGGFARAFIDRGASAFVGCLWSIAEAPGTAFIERFYEDLLAGETIATASVNAREAARASGDATWLAYVVYARPDARLVPA